MIPETRDRYNRQFSVEKYLAFMEGLDRVYPGAIQFRIAETPVFIPKDLGNRILSAGEDIIRVIRQPDFRDLTAGAVPPTLKVPGENDFCEFITLDFAICRDEQGTLVPRLIELQGFPTMFAFQALLADKYREYFQIPDNLYNYFSGLGKDSYLDLFRRILLGKYAPEEVILLEVQPLKQKTRVDFYCTESISGIHTVCITALIQEGHHLFYLLEGKKTRVRRIYNRVIFDDLEQQKKDLGAFVDLTQDLDVEWVPHPNWFYRISKFTIPLIHSPYVPRAYFLDKMEVVPQDLGNYVLKPLFSFAGQGVLIDVTRKDIDAVKDPSNWILQQKVEYAEVIKTTTTRAKCEVRMIYFQENGGSFPIPVNNLARLSRGKMIGVRYNADQDWVGGSICFFEK